MLTQMIEDNSQSRDSERRRLRAFYETCLQLLSHLCGPHLLSVDEFVVDLILALASFTRAEDPWTARGSYEYANILLDKYLKPLRSTSERFGTLLTNLLRDKVKPLFTRSQNPAVTAAGRKAISPLPVPIEHSIDETDMKPWKYRDAYIVTVFEWILQQLDV